MDWLSTVVRALPFDFVVQPRVQSFPWTDTRYHFSAHGKPRNELLPSQLALGSEGSRLIESVPNSSRTALPETLGPIDLRAKTAQCRVVVPRGASLTAEIAVEQSFNFSLWIGKAEFKVASV
jgi:hypothetical protein